jgi:1,4-alpha-glucan branching enzyme
MQSSLEVGSPPASFSAVSRFSVHKTARPVNFVCVAPNAQTVFLTGDFNHWEPTSHPMKRQADGTWTIQVELRHGYQHYRFLVDDQPTLDPKAYGTAHDDFGEKVSLLAVS